MKTYNILNLVSSDVILKRNACKANLFNWHRCYICFLPINPENVTWIEVFDGGETAFIVENTQETFIIENNDSGYMGCFPIGPTCLKRLKGVGIKRK